MKKNLYLLALFLCFTGLFICLFFKGTYYEFNSSNVKNNIDYLSSDKFNGRLAGSSENLEVANEIESLFKQYNLKPLDEDYIENFDTSVPVYTGEDCSLQLYNGSTLSKDFVLGQDFKEDLLNFKKSSIEFSKKDLICIYSNSFSIFQDGIEYLFYINLDKNFSFRSSFFNESKYGFVIQINIQTFNEILDSLRAGSTLKVNLPYRVEEKTIPNVVGKIDGLSSSLPPLILTAHFDHVGCDSIGNIYGGALDNASGISFLLELARTFSTLKYPSRDIIFVALNGEETGLVGSNYFATKYKDILKGSEVINFDMVGVDNIPLTFMSGENSNESDSPLLNNLESLCDEENINYVESFADSSDHASFINNGFDSITISHCDVSNIHTPKDTVDKISVNALNTAYLLVNSEVDSDCYNVIFLLFYKNGTLIFFTLSSSSLLFVKYKHKTASS